VSAGIVYEDDDNIFEAHSIDSFMRITWNYFAD